jgi:uncharacterized membrane protein
VWGSVCYCSATLSTTEIVCAIFAIGILSGLRALSPIAVLCWLALLHRLPVTGWASFAASKVAVVLFSLGALGELISDKLPKTPSRLKQPGFSIRIVMGGLCGLLLASAGSFPLIGGVLLGAIGAIAGSYLGYFARSRITGNLGLPDLPVALVEDVICIAGSFFVVSLFSPR